MNDVFPLAARSSDQEVIRLDITVNQVLLMNRLHSSDLDEQYQIGLVSCQIHCSLGRPTDHLLSDHCTGLYGEFSATHIEQVLHRRTEEIDD
jgi:hypothetical protein